ncbi:MAG: molybdopterin-dependent oxidoreductase [Gemmatimonadota bacterium]|nr:molybdopterin-dependent oxidoreductase [Gemmatimonadota bacterium]
MGSTRRDFLWTMGAAAAAVGVPWSQDVVWESDLLDDPGWTAGIEERFNSACLICPSRCGISARVVDGHLVRLTGNPLHPMNRGGICPRGIAGVQVLYHPDRVTKPLVRVGARGAGEWRELTVDEAIDQIGNRLQGLRDGGRPEALAVLSGFAAASMRDVWHQFLHAYGSPNYVADDYYDGTAAVMGLMHGIPRAPSYDLEHADFVLSFGAPLFESWWSPLQAFVAYANPEAERPDRPRFVQIDTRFSRTAARAHEWVGVRPGTHAVLALGIAYVLIRDELYDAEFVGRNVSGFEDSVDTNGQRREGYRSLVTRRYRTEEVSAITGVPVERVTSLARAFAQRRAPVAVLGADVLRAPNGLLAGVSVHSLNALMGRVNRAGGVLFGRDAPVEALATPASDATSGRGLSQRSVLAEAPQFGEGDPAERFAANVAGASEGEIDTLLFYYANPLASSARPGVWQQALDRIPFVVSFSPFLDETTRQADLVLPDLLPYERWQDAPGAPTYPYAVWALARPVVEPPTGPVHTGDAVLALARRLGGPVGRSLPYESFETLLRARARGLFQAGRGMLLGDAFEREQHRAMEARGWWLPEHTEFEAFWEELVERGGWTDLFYDMTDPAGIAATRSGRIELLPDALEDALREVVPDAALYVDIGPTDTGGSDDFPLRLVPYRVSTLSSGTVALERWLVEQPGLFPDVHWVPWIEVAPATADDLGFDDGTRVWVVSSQGRYRARVKIFSGTAPENVCAPYGLRHPDGELANPLALLDGSTDVLTGLPSWFSTFVRLERA